MKVKGLRIGLLVLVIGCLLAVAGTIYGEGNEEPTYGGVLTIGTFPDELMGLDPHITTSYISTRVLEQIYEGLLRTDENFRVQPALAEDWEISEDGLTYTFYLRTGVKFHDGSDFTASDVKFSLERILNPETASPQRSRLIMIDTIEIVNPHEIRITLQHPFSPFLIYLATSAISAIVSEEFVAREGRLEAVASGTGPFKLVEYDPSQVVLEKNPDYWDDRYPFLDGIVFKLIPEASTRRAAIRTGEIDFIHAADPTTVEILGVDPGFDILSVPEFSYGLLGINNSRPPLDNAKVRLAISCAINRPQIISAVYLGHASIGTPLSPAFGEEWVVPASELPCYQQDYDRARELLREAGYPDGISFEITVAPVYEIAFKFAKVIQDQVKPAGIDIKLNPVEYGGFIDAWIAHDFDTFTSENSGWPDPDAMYYRTFHSQGATNVFEYADPVMDALLEQGRRETDTAKRQEIYKAAQQRLAEQVPIIFLAYGDLFTIKAEYVKGFYPMSSRWLTALRQTWIAKD